MGCRCVKAQVLRESEGPGAADEIEASLSRAETLVRETGARAQAPFIQEERARLAAVRGNTDEARQALEETHRLFLEVGATGHARRIAEELTG